MMACRSGAKPIQSFSGNLHRSLEPYREIGSFYIIINSFGYPYHRESHFR
ncbi:hypothetical protein ES703_73211 [subsurface metagenome]